MPEEESGIPKDARKFKAPDDSQLVEDPVKAEVMARATSKTQGGSVDEFRTNEAEMRARAKGLSAAHELKMSGEPYADLRAESAKKEADRQAWYADKVETEAGQQYDRVVARDRAAAEKEDQERTKAANKGPNAASDEEHEPSDRKK